LQRRLYRNRIDIQGKEIAQYVRALFSVRLDRHHIRFDVTQAFLDSKVHSYPSTIYPVFVNIFDNFIFWLKDLPGERQITLDYADNTYRIENNGPPVQARDKEAIFEQGFSRKPGGRGLGLYISRKVLQKEGMKLELDMRDYVNKGVRFNISWGGNDD
jgi:signal transduction histidine kinase